MHAEPRTRNQGRAMMIRPGWVIGTQWVKERNIPRSILEKKTVTTVRQLMGRSR